MLSGSALSAFFNNCIAQPIWLFPWIAVNEVYLKFEKNVLISLEKVNVFYNVFTCDLGSQTQILYIQIEL